MKRALLAILAVLLVSLACLPALPAAEAADPPIDHGIDYAGMPAATALQLKSKENDSIYIDMNTERLFAPESAKIVGLHNGKKWTKVSIPGDGLDISKLLNKGGIFQLTDQLDAKGKDIVKEEIKAEDGTVTTPKSNVYSFDAIEARPKIDKFMVNFKVYADKTGATPGQWALTPKGSDTPLSAAYQIATTNDKKTPDEKGWGMVPTGRGINVMEMTGTKVTKTNYIIRTAPTLKRPASKIKKLSVAGLGKALKQKADYKKEIIKLKENAAVFVGDETELEANSDETKITIYNKEAAKAGRDIKTEMGETFAIWIAATQKKPATTIQYYTTAERSAMPEAFQPTITTSAVKINTKIYEVEKPDKPGTWATSVPKVTKTTVFNIRAKATAKAGKETDETFAASQTGKLYVTWGVVDAEKKKNGIVDAYIEAPDYPGVIRGRTSQAPETVMEGEGNITLTFDVDGLLSGASVTTSTNSKAEPEAGKILIVPNIAYIKGDNAIKPESLAWTSGASGKGTVTLVVKPNSACTATVGFAVKFGSGVNTKEGTSFGENSTAADPETGMGSNYYCEELAGSRGVRITVNPIEGTYEIQEGTGATGALKAEVKKKSIGSTSLYNASVPAVVGTLSISQNGTLNLGDVDWKGLAGTGTTVGSVFNAANGDTIKGFVARLSEINKLAHGETTIAELNEDTDSENNVAVSDSNGNVAVSGKVDSNKKVERYLAVELYKDDYKVTLWFVFALIDDVKPEIVDATYSGGNIVLTYNESMDGTANGFHVQGANSAQVTQIGSAGTISGSKVTLPYVLSNGSHVLHYKGTALTDKNGNAAAATQAYVGVGSTMPLESITFSNGVAGAPMTFAAPPEISFGASGYDNDIIYVPLGTGDLTKVTLQGSAFSNAKYSIQSSRATSAPACNNSFSSGVASISGLNANTYLYVDAGGQYYCFYITRKSAASGTGAAQISGATVKKTGTEYSIEISFNGVASPIGRLRAANFTLNNPTNGFANATIKTAYFEKSKIVLVLENVSSYASSGDRIAVTYDGNEFDCILGSGGLNGKLTDTSFNVSTAALPAPTPAPSAGS